MGGIYRNALFNYFYKSTALSGKYLVEGCVNASGVQYGKEDQSELSAFLGTEIILIGSKYKLITRKMVSLLQQP